MKRELVAILLLLALLTLSIVNVSYIEHKTDTLSAEIGEAETLYRSGDREGAVSQVKTSLDGWLSWESYSHVMLRHSEIDTISAAYYALLIELEGENSVPEASFQALTETLNDIVKKERVTLGSLL